MASSLNHARHRPNFRRRFSLSTVDAVEGPRAWQELLQRAGGACDELYALGRFREAEDLDAQLEDAIEWITSALEEVVVESYDDADHETGIEDYELDESSDEGYFDSTTLAQYWEPDMFVASDDGCFHGTRRP